MITIKFGKCNLTANILIYQEYLREKDNMSRFLKVKIKAAPRYTVTRAIFTFGREKGWQLISWSGSDIKISLIPTETETPNV